MNPEGSLRRLLARAIWETFDEDPEFMLHRSAEVASVAPIYARMYSRGVTGYRVDFEYDRQGTSGNMKRDNSISSTVGRKGSRRPDVVVHQRGHDAGNLLVVEFKLLDDDSRDHDRVKKLMSHTAGGKAYRFGATVVLGPAAGRNPCWRWFDSPDAAPNLEPVPRPSFESPGEVGA
jgi:hypothetical protein